MGSPFLRHLHPQKGQDAQRDTPRRVFAPGATACSRGWSDGAATPRRPPTRNPWKA